MGINFRSISIAEILEANSMFNFGVGNLYKIIHIPKSDFERISKLSIIEFDSLLHPYKTEFEKSKVDRIMNYIPHLHPEIQEKKEKLLKLLDTLFDGDIFEGNYGVSLYKDFIIKHFDLILNSIKFHFQSIYARNKLDFIEENKIKINFLGLYLLSYSYFISNEREKEFYEPDKNSRCLNDNYIFIFNQYVLLHENFLLKKEFDDLKIIKEHLDNMYKDNEVISKQSSSYLPGFSKKITPAVLFKLIDLLKGMSYDKALRETAGFFGDLPKSMYNRQRFNKSTLKNWIHDKKKYYAKFKYKKDTDIADIITKDDVMAWFKALARIDDRYIDLIPITGVPIEKSHNDEIERSSKKVRELESKILLSNLCDGSNNLVQLSLQINWIIAHKLFLKCFSRTEKEYNQNHTRTVISFIYLKSKHKLDYKETKRRWLENPYWQLFCGEDFFRAEFPIHFQLLKKEMQLDEEKINSIIENSLPKNYYKLQ